LNENIFIERDLDKNIANIKKLTLGSFDVVSREFTTVSGARMCLFFVDGLVAKQTIHDNIIKPCLEASFRMAAVSIRDIVDVLVKLLSAGDVKEDHSLSSCITKMLSGDTILMMDDQNKALVIQTRGWNNRGIQRPQTQNSVRGPQEAFTETLLFNTALLRRKIRTEKMKMEIMQVGKMSKTDICIAWVDGVADSGLVNTVRGRLKKIDVDYILESGHIEQLIEDNSRSLFSTIGNNEKPDIVAAKMMKGRVAIIVDGSPFVLTVPMLFMEGFHVAEDYYSRPFYSNLLRFLRICSYILTLFLPAVYIALVNFHQEMIPQKLLYTIMKSKDGIPLTSFLEILLMLVLYEILREAVL
jgi:spore germination protein KA